MCRIGTRQVLSPYMSYSRELAQALEGLMGSPGHRVASLGAHHRQVQLGLARSCDRVVLVQVPITDLLHWEQPPHIAGDLLVLQGRAVAPVRTSGQLEVLIAWEPLPQPNTVGQLNGTGCYSQPPYVAAAMYRHRPRAELRVPAVHCVTPQAANLGVPHRPGRPTPESYTLPFLVRECWGCLRPAFHAGAVCDRGE